MIKTLCTLLVGGFILSMGTANAQSTDRETVARTIAGSAGGRVAVALAGSPASTNAAVKNTKPDKEALVGSWLETVTFLDPPFEGRLLKSLVSFHGDGTMVTSDQGSVTTDPPSVSSSGHGAWLWVEKQQQFVYTVLELFSDLSGNLAGYLKVRGSYTVMPSGDKYTGTSFFEVFDASWNLQVSGNVDNAGERIKAELP